MDKKLHISFYSQHSDDISSEWKDKVCGIACIKMVLQYLGKSEVPETMDLIKECKYIGGYDSSYGWTHDALVSLMRNYGILAYRQEFRSHQVNPSEKTSSESKYQERFISAGTNKIIQSIEKGSPVIVSVKEGFDTNTSTHLILITGFKTENNIITGFFYFDPNIKGKTDDKPQLMSLDRFNSNWRKLAIFTA